MATAAQDLLNDQPANEQLIAKTVEAARQEIDTIADITNSAEVKTHLIGVLLERSLKHLLA
jgi:carbon-monoxide dehydrogenase medium subunit